MPALAGSTVRVVFLLAIIAAAEARRVQQSTGNSLNLVSKADATTKGKPFRSLAKFLVRHTARRTPGEPGELAESELVVLAEAADGYVALLLELFDRVSRFVAAIVSALSLCLRTFMSGSGLMLVLGMCTGEFRTFSVQVEKRVQEFLDHELHIILRESSKRNLIDRLMASIFAPVTFAVMLPILMPIALVSSVVSQLSQSLVRMLPALIVTAVVFSHLPAPVMKFTTNVLKYTGAIFWAGMILGVCAAIAKELQL